MSSTRKKKRDQSADNYPTPEWAVERFLERWPELEGIGDRWLEPSVGDGSIIEVVDQFRPDIEWTTCDIRDTTPKILDLGIDPSRINVGSFFELPEFEPVPGSKPWDVIIMNPPFRLTLDFLVRSWALARVVVLFQSINFSGSEDRNEILVPRVPDLYLLPDRVSHTGDGKSDSVYSGWHVWPTEFRPEGRYRILKHTPLEIRRAQHTRVRVARDEVAVGLDALFAEI